MDIKSTCSLTVKHEVKGLLQNFAQFSGKHLCQSLFFNKVAGAACSFVKKEILVQVFSSEFCKILKRIFLTEHLRKQGWTFWGYFFERGFPKTEQGLHSKDIYEFMSFVSCRYYTIIPPHLKLAVVKGLPTKKFLPKCVNQKSSTERCS